MIRYNAHKWDESVVLVRVESSEEFKNGFIPVMQTLIDYFNTEYKWDEMFSIDDVVKRLDDSNTLFILFYEKNPIGYVFFKELNSTTTFLYNFYVTKIIDRDKNVPITFVNAVLREMFKKYTDIQLECEDWNIAAQKIFEINGFRKIND